MRECKKQRDAWWSIGCRLSKVFSHVMVAALQFHHVCRCYNLNKNILSLYTHPFINHTLGTHVDVVHLTIQDIGRKHILLETNNSDQTLTLSIVVLIQTISITCMF